MSTTAPELVHSRLARWATERGAHPAIRSEAGDISFAEFAARVDAHAAALRTAGAPATVLQDASLPLLERLVAFMGTVASGRCAAVSDPAWPPAVLQAVRERLPVAPHDNSAPTPWSPFYTGFTSGSTGLPKGFRRHHQSWTESFDVCLRTFGPAAGGCILAPGRDSHSLFLFGMLLGLWTGGGVVVQEQFSAAAALATLRSGQTPCLVAVPSQLLLMLEWAQHRQLPPVPDVQLILISGARWPRGHTPALQALFPQARIIEFYGASETSFIAWTESHADLPDNLVGQPFDTVELDVRGATPDSPDGLIYVRSPMLFMDYVATDADTPPLCAMAIGCVCATSATWTPRAASGWQAARAACWSPWPKSCFPKSWRRCSNRTPPSPAPRCMACRTHSGAPKWSPSCNLQHLQQAWRTPACKKCRPGAGRGWKPSRSPAACGRTPNGPLPRVAKPTTSPSGACWRRHPTTLTTHHV